MVNWWTPCGHASASANGPGNSNDFTLNSIPWHLWATTDYGTTQEDFLERVHGQERAGACFDSGAWDSGGRLVSQNLDWFDEQGVPVRSSGIFDGEGPIIAWQFEGGKVTSHYWTTGANSWPPGSNHETQSSLHLSGPLKMRSCSSILGTSAWPRSSSGNSQRGRGGGETRPTRPTMVDGGRLLAR